MKRTVRSIVVLLMGVLLLAGLSGCNGIPEEITSRLPEISLSPRPTDGASETAATTPAPETEEPAPEVTETVTETAAPETVTASPSSEPPAEEETQEDDPVPAWVWWAVGLLVLALVVVTILLWRALTARAAWDRRRDDARSEFAWLEDSVVPQVLAKPTAAEASALWEATRPRVLETDKALHTLIEDAPTDDREESARQGLVAFGALVAAIDDETSTQAGTDADSLRANRAALDTARARARQWIAASQK